MKVISVSIPITCFERNLNLFKAIKITLETDSCHNFIQNRNYNVTAVCGKV